MTNQANWTKPLMLAVSLFGLSACMQTAVETPSPAETVMRNSVQMVRMNHEIKPEDDGTATPSRGTLAAVDGFLMAVQAGYADVIMLDHANAGDARLAAISDYIRAKGLAFGGTATLGAEPADGAIMLYLERYVVTVPNCGEWKEETGNNTRNNSSSFFSCSTNANLGLMIANPRDLIAGQNSGNSTAAAVGALYTPQPAAPAPAPGTTNMTLTVTAPPTNQNTGGTRRSSNSSSNRR